MSIETETWVCICGAINGLARKQCGICKEVKVRDQNDTE